VTDDTVTSPAASVEADEALSDVLVEVAAFTVAASSKSNRILKKPGIFFIILPFGETKFSVIYLF
jgi:hypothetical protein